MKITHLLAAAGATLCFVGCFSTDAARIKSTGAEHVVMNNYGWKLFDWIPLFSGNASDGSGGIAFFRDDVTMDNMQARFNAYANGRSVDCPMYDANDTVVVSLLGIPIPYIFTYKELTLSGTVK